MPIFLVDEVLNVLLGLTDNSMTLLDSLASTCFLFVLVKHVWLFACCLTLRALRTLTSGSLSRTRLQFSC
jgi:hypothetical protein